MEEYLKTLLEQVRCKKAHPAIEKEVRSHIEEQAQANMETGMDEEQAMRLAVCDMGDPVETGVELDRVHRPQTAWGLIAVMAVVSLASLAIHIVIGMGAEEIGYQTQHAYMMSAVCYVGFGFLLMLLVYRLDYSILAKHGRLAACLFLAAMTLEVYFFGNSLNGSAAWLSIGGLNVSMIYVMFLYIPLYGAVLYHYRGSGWAGILKSIGFLLYPVWLEMRMPCTSLALQMLLMMSMMLSVAVVKDWFFVSKKLFLAAYWVMLPLLLIAGSLIRAATTTRLILTTYQQARVKAFLGGTVQNDADYVAKMLMEYLKNSRMFGASGYTVAGFLPDYYSEYILTFLSSYYGTAAAIAICLAVAAVSAKAFRIAFFQKNQLGMMMGLGSGMVLLFNTLLNMAENFGALPRTATFLPFFSYTGTGMAVSYILIGIVLSVYRYKDIPIYSKSCSLQS